MHASEVFNSVWTVKTFVTAFPYNGPHFKLRKSVLSPLLRSENNEILDPIGRSGSSLFLDLGYG